jgi:CheY-like chemotaxis protein
MKAPVDSVVTILLVGNSVLNASVFRDQLRRLGCAVSSAASCKAALHSLRQRKFDVVLTEFLLPDANAYQLLAPLRSTRTTVFFNVPLEDDSLWVPVLDEGRDRLGAPAIQPAQFAKALQGVLTRKRAKCREERNYSPMDTCRGDSPGTNRKPQPATANDVSTRYRWEQWHGKKHRQA